MEAVRVAATQGDRIAGSERPQGGSEIRRGSLKEAENEEKFAICNALAATLYGMPVGLVSERTRKDRRVVEARQLSEYLANVLLGLSYEEIAVHSGRDRTTVRHSIERVEDRRENPHFDTALVALETFIGCLVDNEFCSMIENGLRIDYDLVAFIP